MRPRGEPSEGSSDSLLGGAGFRSEDYSKRQIGNVRRVFGWQRVSVATEDEFGATRPRTPCGDRACADGNSGCSGPSRQCRRSLVVDIVGQAVGDVHVLEDPCLRLHVGGGCAVPVEMIWGNIEDGGDLRMEGVDVTELEARGFDDDDLVLTVDDAAHRGPDVACGYGTDAALSQHRRRHGRHRRFPVRPRHCHIRRLQVSGSEFELAPHDDVGCCGVNKRWRMFWNARRGDNCINPEQLGPIPGTRHHREPFASQSGCPILGMVVNANGMPAVPR